MTVRITSPVLGKDVGDSYTGTLESWLLHEGYATTAATIPDAWGLDDDDILGAEAPSVTVTPTAAVLTGATNALTLTTTGSVVFGTVGGVSTTVALASGDTAAQAATKIDTALSAKADAAIVSSKLQVTSNATGTTAYVTVISGNATILTKLGLSVDQIAYGGDGRPTGASNLGAQADLPENDPVLAENREAPYFPATEDRTANIANDGDHLTETSSPNENFDFDPDATNDDDPVIVSVTPASGLEGGGTDVTIAGTGFVDVTDVEFDGEAAEFVIVSDYEITATTPEGTIGDVDLVVTNESGSDTLTDGFEYLIDPDYPVITSVTPATDVAAGGVNVTIVGENFTGTTSVKFGGTTAAFVITNDTHLAIADAPAHAAGVVAVEVTNAAGTRTAPAAFTYTA